MQSEFNLIDEPWICVRTAGCSIKEVSLQQLFANAHEYVGLAGETKTQDFAVLRLLLAILHTVFSRYDIDGENAQDIGFDDKVDLWREIWERKRFPEKPINRYLEEWHERFWLFDEKYPFYQSKAAEDKVSDKDKGRYDISKMIGTMFQSGNKKRIFADRKGEGVKLFYDEAARWLLHINCYDDIAAKKPTPKKAYAGQLGLIAVKGKNLFETMMLNFVADDKEEVVVQKPAWEQKKDSCADEFNRIIMIPDNQAELLTLQSRRVYLYREEDKVTGYYIAGGDYFEEEDIYPEWMTLWKGYSETKNSEIKMKPRLHDTSKQVWQEFGAIAAFPDTEQQDNIKYGKRTPGVIAWVNRLLRYRILDRKYRINVSTAAVIYDTGQATSLPVKDMISDTLTFHSHLLLEEYRDFRSVINAEIEKCENASNAVRLLSIHLQKASGASGDRISGDDAKTQFYSRIDRPFRLWLRDIKDDDNAEDLESRLESRLYKIALKLGKELSSELGDGAIFGRYLKGEDKKKTEICSSAQALNMFIGQIKKIFDKAGEENE